MPTVLVRVTFPWDPTSPIYLDKQLLGFIKCMLEDEA